MPALVAVFTGPSNGCHTVVLLLLLLLCVPPAGPSYGSNEAQGVDKLPDVLVATGRQAASCLVDRQGTLAKHATGAAAATAAHAPRHGGMFWYVLSEPQSRGMRSLLQEAAWRNVGD